MVARPEIGKPLVVIVGATATGKSDLAFKLADKFNSEIISADSWLVRKNVDIGTSKPDLALRRRIHHHLIDVIEPCQDFSAAEYKKLAEKAIDDIYSRGKMAIMVGGTGLYIDAIIYNYSFLPPSTPEERTRLNSLNLASLQQLAIDRGLDLSTVDERNKRRVVRLIETNGGVATKGRVRPNTLIIGIASEASELKRAIVNRVDRMFASGLELEVKTLKDKYGWDCEALKGIGYSEWRLYFEGTQSLETTRERIIKDTIDLAKRQSTWFKRNKSIHWFSTPVNITSVEDLITTV